MKGLEIPPRGSQLPYYFLTSILDFLALYSALVIGRDKILTPYHVARCVAWTMWLRQKAPMYSRNDFIWGQSAVVKSITRMMEVHILFTQVMCWHFQMTDPRLYSIQMPLVLPLSYTQG